MLTHNSQRFHNVGNYPWILKPFHTTHIQPIYPMKFKLKRLGIAFWLLLMGSCQQKNRLETYLESLPASLVISFHIQDKNGEILASQNAVRQIPSASIIKIPILIELMRQVEAGRLSLDQEIMMTEEDVVSGAGELQFQPVGTTYTMDYLAREMIRISDNVATNLLIKELGMASIQGWLTENGYKNTQLNRIMMDFGAIAAGRQNYTCPKEMTHLLANLYIGRYLADNSTGLVMELLKGCADRSTIPSKLPAEIQVAHKTGTLDYVRGDAGIILGDKPLIIAVFVEGFESMDQAEVIIGEIARIAWETF